MADRAAIALPALPLEVDHLLAALDSVDGERHLCALHVGGADLEGRPVGDGANRIQDDFLPGFGRV